MNRYEKALNEWPSFFSIENNIQVKSNSLKQLIKQKLEIEQKLFNANENIDRMKVLVKTDKLKLEKNKLEIIRFKSAHIEYERNQIIIQKYKVTQFLSLIDDILDKYSKRYLDQNIKIQKLQTERSMWQENLNEAIENVEVVIMMRNCGLEGK